MTSPMPEQVRELVEMQFRECIHDVAGEPCGECGSCETAQALTDAYAEIGRLKLQRGAQYTPGCRCATCLRIIRKDRAALTKDNQPEGSR